MIIIVAEVIFMDNAISSASRSIHGLGALQDPHAYAGAKNKFKDLDADFHKQINSILALGLPPIDLIHQFPIHNGYVNLARYLFLYDLYKQCYQLSGHLADLGTWKGASFFFMAKLVKIFEPLTLTQVHGFDWFEGMKQTAGEDDTTSEGTYAYDYTTLLKLIQIQEFEDIAILHKMDLTTDLGPFFEKSPYLRFKMVFIDCGTTKVIDKSLEYFWPRLVQGGILIMDHYNCESSPSESKLLEKYVGKNHIRQSPFTRSPTAYVIKEQ